MWQNNVLMGIMHIMGRIHVTGVSTHEMHILRGVRTMEQDSVTLPAEVASHERSEAMLRLDEARLETLLKLSRMTEYSLKEISDFALEEAVRLTRSEIGFVGLLDEHETELTVHAWSSAAMEQCAVHDQPKQFPVEGAGLWGETVRQRRPVVVNDYAKLTTWKKGCPKGHVKIRRYLGIPVFDGERIAAVAAVANKKDDYDNGDIRQLTLLMDGTWRLVERKRVDDALRQAHEDLEDQVEARTAVLMATNRELRQEIVQRALAKEALREKEEQYRTLVETIPHGIQEVDLDGTITFANAVCHRIYSSPDGSMVGTRVWDAVASRVEQNSLRKYFQVMVDEQPEPTPYFGQDRTKDGKIIDVRVDWDYKRDNAGKLTGIVAVLTDITDQRRAEEQARRRLDDLAHVVRLSTMGEMVSGLAHELNQPLAAIAGYAQACQYQVQILKGEGQDEVLDFVGQISEQANRAGEIIRHLRDFVRRADSGRSPIDINDLICDVAVLLEVETRLHDVRLELALDRSLPSVSVDQIQIEQVVTNLVYNAMEATQEVPQEYRTVTVRTSLKDISLVEVAVEDTGKGLQTKNIDRLFEPFYTTKENGMGLGLSISRSIVESHGGQLQATPDAERGATFRFTLLSAQGEGDKK